jgi:hypothetical protein
VIETFCTALAAVTITAVFVSPARKPAAMADTNTGPGGTPAKTKLPSLSDVVHWGGAAFSRQTVAPAT